MSTIAPKTFKSSDSGAPPCDGLVGSLIEILSSCLVVRKAFSAVSGASFVDTTTEARLQGGTAVTPFVGPATTNEYYIGMCQPFEQVKFLLSTLGVGGTYTWQFWNGSAWTTFSVTDGTAGFVQNGAVSWSIAARTGWVPNAVNGSTLYWVRVLMASTPSTNPLIGSLTVTGWSEAYTGTNLRAYQMGGGNQVFLDVDDNGPGAGAAKEARIRGYETMSAVATGTGPTPTVAQETNGIIVRKSAAASATTRTWILVCDDRTAYFFSIPGDSGNSYTGFAFGDVLSLVASDPYRCCIIGRASSVENTTVGSSDLGAALNTLNMTNNPAYALAANGKYVMRPYTAAVGSVAIGTTSSLPLWKLQNDQLMVLRGGLTYPNEIDGGVYAAPVWFFEGAGGIKLRGRLRGFWHWGHAYNSVADQTAFSGVGALAGKSFLLLQPAAANANGTPSAFFLETSDTWETN